MDPTDYDTDHEYEYEYDDVPPDGTRILWGRVAVLGLALLLVFAIGRCSVDTSAEAEEDVEALRDQVEALQQENNELQAHVDALEAGAENGTEVDEDAEDAQAEAPEPDSEDDAAEEPDEGDDEAEESDEGGARTHEVQADENLFSIAQDYYGDGTKFELIADANGLSETDSIHEGQVLEIPPDD